MYKNYRLIQTDQHAVIFIVFVTIILLTKFFSITLFAINYNKYEKRDRNKNIQILQINSDTQLLSRYLQLLYYWQEISFHNTCMKS